MKNYSTLLIFLVCLLFVMPPGSAPAQCTPNTSLTQPGIYPNPMPDGCVGVPYNEVVQFVFPIDTVISGFTIPFDSFQITSITSVPTGLSYVCNNPTCKFIPAAPGQPARGCIVVSGTPTMPFNPNNMVDVNFTGWGTIFGSPQSLNSSVQVQLDIYSSSTAAFGTSISVNTVTFTNSSSGATAYLWDFGDGNTSTAFSPTHTYASQGNYLVCLTATNGNCPDSTCQVVTTGCPAPTPLFNASPSNLTVTFQDQTLGTPNLWLWDFGDGNTSTAQNPSHTYAATGVYTVCLTVTDSCGTDSTCQIVTVTCPVPAAAFTSSSNLLVTSFTDGSTTSGGNTSFFWDFGDGNTSTVQNPTHTYAAAGTYTACLTVTDDCGADSVCQNVTVVAVGLPEPAFFGDLTVFPNPNAGTFTLRGQLLADFPLEIRVADVVGKVLYHDQVAAGFGEFSRRIELDRVAAGLYFVRVSAGREIRTLKVRVD